jgi:hypothetical protein
MDERPRRELIVVIAAAATAFCGGYFLQLAVNGNAVLDQISRAAVSTKHESEALAAIVTSERAAFKIPVVASAAWIVAGLAVVLLGARRRTSNGYTQTVAGLAMLAGIGLGILACLPFLRRVPHEGYSGAPIIACSLVAFVGLIFLFVSCGRARIGRVRYVLSLAALCFVSAVVLVVSRSRWVDPVPVGVLVSLLSVPLAVGRLRDLGLPASHYFLLLLPGYGFPYLGFRLVFQRGKVDDNSGTALSSAAGSHTPVREAARADVRFAKVGSVLPILVVVVPTVYWWLANHPAAGNEPVRVVVRTDDPESLPAWLRKVDKSGSDRGATQANTDQISDRIRGLLKRFISTRGSRTELLSIMRYGKEAVPPIIDILEGRDTEMIAFVASSGGKGRKEFTSHVRLAASVLGAMGWPQATSPMLRALESADSDVTRATIAAALLRLATTPEIVEAYKATYARIDPTSKLDEFNFVRPFLLGCAGYLLDSSMVPWVLDQVRNSRGKSDRLDTQDRGLNTAFFLMERRQIPDVRAAVKKADFSTWDNWPGIQAQKSAAALLTECKEHVDCYLHKLLATPKKKADSMVADRMVHDKAGAMLAMLGTAETLDKIVSALPTIKAPESQYATLSAIEHLARTDPQSTANALEKILLADATGNEVKPSEVNPSPRTDLALALEEVILRLRAR